MGFSRQEYWSGMSFPSPVDHILSDLSTMTRPTWVAPQAWLSFIELDKAVVLVWLDRLVFCDYGFSVSALLQHLLFYLVFSYLGRGVSLHGCSIKEQSRARAARTGHRAQAAAMVHIVRPRGATPCPRSGATARRSNSTSKERWLRGCRRAERSYSTFKVKRGGGEEIPLIQGKEQRLRLAGAAVKRYPTSKVRETQVRR